MNPQATRHIVPPQARGYPDRSNRERRESRHPAGIRCSSEGTQLRLARAAVRWPLARTNDGKGGAPGGLVAGSRHRHRHRRRRGPQAWRSRDRVAVCSFSPQPPASRAATSANRQAILTVEIRVRGRGRSATAAPRAEQHSWSDCSLAWKAQPFARYWAGDVAGERSGGAPRGRGVESARRRPLA
jgi:hypothetical protein